MTTVYDEDFITAPPAPVPLVFYNTGYAPLTHITAGGEHFLRSGGPNKDYGVDANHAPGLMNLLAIFHAAHVTTPRLRGGNLRLWVRLNEFYLPNPARLALLVQSKDKRVYNGYGHHTTVNSVQVNDLICEQLGVPRPYLRAAGTSGDRILNIPNWTEVNIPLSENAADWIYMPPEPNDPGSYPPSALPTAPLDGGLVNFMIVALFGTSMPTYEAGSVEGYAPADQGIFDIDRVLIEV